MSTLARRSNVSIPEHVRSLDPKDFGPWAEGQLETAMRLTNAVSQEVQEGKITTLQGAGILACTMGQLYDYGTFHDPQTLAYLSRADQGSGSQNPSDR